MRLKFLTWDVKDTLLRLRLPVGQQYYNEAKCMGLQVDPASLETSFRQAYQSHCRLFPNYGLTQGMTSHQWWLDVVAQTFRLSGVEEEKSVQTLAEKLYQDFCTARNWEVLPGAREALDGCKNLGLRMAVISNFDRRLEEVLRHCELDKHFEFVMTSESAGISKPNVRIFHKALNLANVAPNQAAHIGDDFINDYSSARMAGMSSYLIQRKKDTVLGEQSVPKEYIIDSPLQLIPRLQSLMK
ncbi:haloacid dehalogenase-like hydrolase domain-containing protein 3 [Bombina bombina]|uniref:haloacid dehalogenase-like hydrolase domain-containing protein 3 n=1 Tax=Bombina bombina TaxID=8345 RepID=UPI00235B20C4|nr:haloacid dehalogenase-like hydrolase domain-containing protein 3 [Bombina bombina]XP_053551983.1 haloacid dehalogenase-like hydrolase domain-containing protein 3 [Bombina bombina]XP_053551984.1 haloacid dehalogenase-like hydrolase domain-containing protein 3 [Bombina bombina]